VLNANYIRKKLEDLYELPYKTASMHEVVFSDKRQAAKGVKTGDIAKRLIDYGFHPYTVSFPMIVHGALMIEPTESESLEELDLFIAAMRSIAREVDETPELVKSAPHSTRVSKLDEVQAPESPSSAGGRGRRTSRGTSRRGTCRGFRRWCSGRRGARGARS
jgi:glycine dehydrogenase subunit 2